MATLIRTIWLGYGFIFDELADPRTKSWFLVAKPYQGLCVLGLYLLFVLKIGPNWMKNRQPFNVDKLMIIHNLIQVVACSYVFYEAIIYAWGWNYRWFCEPIDYSYTEHALNVAGMAHHYYMLKYLDLLDTIFFVLRKKSNQISFLHIYHHTGMVMMIWGAVTYFPGGHGTLIGMVNSFVHVVMYGYYLLTVAMPSVKQSLWWKKHITQIQIIQLAWCCIHMFVLVFKQDCEYPRWVAILFLPNDLFMLTLFVDFYIRTYIKKPKVTPVQSESKEKMFEESIVRQRTVVDSQKEL
ncbi:unnamed protein product [Pieris macdunnoughi]|uniref:Elongation of very long chain fatty acids protein n=1 Tax=Pieris macdunnoughi TaxID=345717 RepID=A0A821LPB7_9NEOP|nr:unnamed protein product [Pieris macdunnoughi]